MGCGCLFALLGAIFPRVAIVVLLFFSEWFERAFDGILIPVLGLIFLPYTLLWYTVVMNVYRGEWGLMQILLLVVAVMLDLSSLGGSRSVRRYHARHEEEY